MTQSIEQLLTEAVAYDPQSGALTWRERPAHHFISPSKAKAWNDRFAGLPAFNSKNSIGYRHGKIGGRNVSAHRAAWFLMTGVWPEGDIDHLNRDRADNRWENMRASTRAQNHFNRSKSTGRSSIYKGVHRVASTGKYVAQIKLGGVSKHLGTFACETAAAIAHRISAIQQRGEYHG